MYQRQNLPSANTTEMAAGTEIHRQHGRTVMASGCLRLLAAGLLLAALALLVAHFVEQML